MKRVPIALEKVNQEQSCDLKKQRMNKMTLTCSTKAKVHEFEKQKQSLRSREEPSSH